MGNAAPGGGTKTPGRVRGRCGGRTVADNGRWLEDVRGWLMVIDG